MMFLKVAISLTLLLIPVNFYSIFKQIIKTERTVAFKDKQQSKNSVYSKPKGRLGLFFTVQEVAIWKERAKKGPYKTFGDVSENSPGDWDRITKNAKEFLQNPSQEIWRGDTSSGCVQKGSEEPTFQAVKLKDAAFYYLITEDPMLIQPIKNVLLKQVSQPLTDFSNRKRWCPNIMVDVNPSFVIAEWLTRLILTYDFIKNKFLPSEKRELETWFKNAAIFFMEENKRPFEKIFISRADQDYNLTSLGKALKLDKVVALTHSGGKKVSALATYYNNRRATIARFVTFTGITVSNSDMVESSKLFVKEWLKFSVFPDGIIGEYKRWKNTHPDLGWSYGSSIISVLLQIADALARSGDMELYNYSTSYGLFGTEGGEKSLLLTAKTLLSFIDGTTSRTIPITGESKSIYDTKIDGIVKEKNWYAVNEIWLLPSNLYYKDKYIENVYSRTVPKRTFPSPEKVASTGPYHPWSGSGTVFPGILFMFGNLENMVHPYN